MDFRKAQRKVITDFKQLVLGRASKKCEDGIHCAQVITHDDKQRWPVPVAAADGVQNPQIYSGTLAARPAPGTYPQIAGEPVYYWATDIMTMFQDTGAAWIVVGAEWFVRDLHVEFGNGPFGGGGWGYPSSAWVYFSPVQVPRTCTADGIIVYHGAGAVNNIYVALYDELNWQPNNRLAVSANTAAAGINQREFVPFTSPVRITPGVYWAAFIVNAGNFPFIAQFLVLPANVNHGLMFFRQNIGGYAIPPDPATPVVADSDERCYNMTLRVSAIP